MPPIGAADFGHQRGGSAQRRWRASLSRPRLGAGSASSGVDDDRAGRSPTFTGGLDPSLGFSASGSVLRDHPRRSDTCSTRPAGALPSVAGCQTAGRYVVAGQHRSVAVANCLDVPAKPDNCLAHPDDLLSWPTTGHTDSTFTPAASSYLVSVLPGV